MVPTRTTCRETWTPVTSSVRKTRASRSRDFCLDWMKVNKTEITREKRDRNHKPARTRVVSDFQLRLFLAREPCDHTSRSTGSRSRRGSRLSTMRCSRCSYCEKRWNTQNYRILMAVIYNCTDCTSMFFSRLEHLSVKTLRFLVCSRFRSHRE